MRYCFYVHLHGIRCEATPINHDAILGKEIKKELQAGSIALDLPKDHELRKKMANHERELKEHLETLLSMALVCGWIMPTYSPIPRTIQQPNRGSRNTMTWMKRSRRRCLLPSRPRPLGNLITVHVKSHYNPQPSSAKPRNYETYL